MKLNINPKELLALYNVLYERYESCAGGTCYKEDDERAAADTNLHELYKRVKACIIASLTNKMVDPLDSWMEGQQRRIGELHDQNDKVKKEAQDLAAGGEVEGSLKPIILSAEDTDVLPESYPRKGPPPPVMPRGGKYRGHRR